MLPSRAGPLQLGDNLRLTANTPSGLWSATASGRLLPFDIRPPPNANAALRSGRLHWLLQTGCGRSDLVGECRRSPREDRACQPLRADIDAFSLHAAVWVEAHVRKRLEQLCR